VQWRRPSKRQSAFAFLSFALIEQGITAISHLSEQFGLFGVLGEIVELIGIGAKIEQLFKLPPVAKVEYSR
jgi:hypothetical protein